MSDGIATFPGFGAGNSGEESSSEPSTGPLLGGASRTQMRMALAHGYVEPEALLSPGDEVAQYEIVKRIGSGGFGAVYEARDKNLHRVVAIKTVRPRGAPLTADAMDALAIEARRLAQLRHPDIITVHELLLGEERPMLVMEYFAGQPFERWCFSQGARWPVITRLVERAARALDFAHQRGLVHRDVSSANLLVSGANDLRLLDFGLSALRGSEPTPAAAVGTRTYAAPEVSKGAADEASDQYSLAVVLGRALYADTFDRGGSLPARRHPQLGGHRVPVGLRRVLQRALRRNPRERFGSCEAFADALAAVLTRRRRLWIAAGALLLAGGVASLSSSAAATQTCTQVGEEIELTWPQARRDALRARMLATGGPVDEGQLATVMQVGTRYAERWAEERRDLCEDRVAGHLEGDEFRRRELCLEHRRSALENGLAVLEEQTNIDAVSALAVLEDLPGYDGCSLAGRAEAQAVVSASTENLADADVWARLGRARARRAVADYEGALLELDAAQALLDASDAPPSSQARLALEHGRVLDAAGHYRDAEEAFRRGLEAAERSGSPTLRIDALVGLAHVLGVRLQRRAASMELLSVAEALLAGLELQTGADAEAVGLYEAPIVLGRAENEFANSDYVAALEHYEHLLKMPASSFDRLLVEERMAEANFFFQGRSQARLRELLAVAERLTERYGPGHPRTLRMRLLAATASLRTGHEHEARAALDELEGLVAALPDSPRRDELRALWFTVDGQLQFRLDDFWGAHNAFQAALDIERLRPEPDAYAMGRALTRLGAAYSNMGNQIRAIELHEEAVDTIERAGGPEHAVLAMPYINLAAVYERLDDQAAAGAAYVKAAAVCDAPPRRDSMIYDAAVAYQRAGKLHEAEMLLRPSLEAAEESIGGVQSMLEIAFERGGADAHDALQDAYRRSGYSFMCPLAESMSRPEVNVRCYLLELGIARERGQLDAARRIRAELEDFMSNVRLDDWTRQAALAALAQDDR